MPAFLPGDLRNKPISLILVSSCETTPRRYHHSYEPSVPLIRIVSSLTQTEMLMARNILAQKMPGQRDHGYPPVIVSAAHPMPGSGAPPGTDPIQGESPGRVSSHPLI